MTEGTKIRGNIDHLVNTVNYFKEFVNNLNNFNKTLITARDAVSKTPVKLDDTMYQRYFNNSNNNITRIDGAKENINTILNLLHTITEKMSESSALSAQMRDELNKNKLKFGLQGQIRSMIDNTQLPPDIPETVRNVINAPNVEQPNPSGGKHRRKTKTRRTRKRKSVKKFG